MVHVVIDRYFSLFLEGLKIFLNPRLSLISCVHTAGCKSTYHRWQVPPGGAPVVSGGENAAGCNLPPTKLDLPPTIYL